MKEDLELITKSNSNPKVVTAKENFKLAKMMMLTKLLNRTNKRKQ